MTGWLAGVYRAWPWRPHCDGNVHVLGCRLAARLGLFEGNTRCPAKDA